MAATYKLFVYGTLANRSYFRIITGKDLPRRPAMLPNFERVVSQRAFPYITPCRGASAEGVLIEGIDPETLAHLDEYEDNGRLYNRKPVMVLAGSEQVIAYTYVGNAAAISEHFGLGLEEADRVEQHLDEEISATIARAARSSDGEVGELDVRARRELLGDTIAEVRRVHFQNPSWSPFMMRYHLERKTLPSLDWLRSDPEAQRYAPNYLRLIARIIVFNQTEKKVRQEFRGAVRVSDPYYEHSVSVLVAFTFLNERAAALDAAIGEAGLDAYHPDWEYLDYAREAIRLADHLYDHEAAAEVLAHIDANRQVGATPLGAELEFSHLGARAVHAKPGEDPELDSLYYGHDFDLVRRLWKVGGYVDDHTGVMFDESRSRGFLELAFGRLRVGGDLSRPATNDVWILSQLIQQAMRFVPVRPHSTHISLQADADRPFTQLENPQFLLCLLLLGGDISPDATGVLREKRIFQKEIINPYTGMDYSRLNAHRADEDEAQATSVVEYTFARLDPARDYEALILALKGFQAADNPMPLDLSEKCPYRGYHRQLEKELARWARRPQPLSEAEINAFVEDVARGLRREQATGSGHSPDYIAEGVSRIASILENTNRAIRESTRRTPQVRRSPQ